MNHCRLLFALLVLAATGANGQLTLDATRMPVAGESFRSFAVDTTGVEEGPAGANQVWDFSSIQVQGEQSELMYASPAGTPYAGDFPASNLVGYAESDDPVYTYMQVNGNQASILGMRSGEIEVTYDDPQVHVSLPFTYNSTFSDPFSGTMVVLSGAYTARRTGTNMAVGDAYGTITLPGGGTYDALRVMHVLSTADTVSLPGFTIVTTTLQTSYEWWIAGARFPVLIVSHLRTETLGNVYESKFIEYNNEITTEVGDPVEPVVSDFRLEQNFPNPFNPATTIRFTVPASGPATLKVYDLVGQEVATLVDGHLRAGAHQVTFNGSHLPSEHVPLHLAGGNISSDTPPHAGEVRTNYRTNQTQSFIQKGEFMKTQSVRRAGIVLAALLLATVGASAGSNEGASQVERGKWLVNLGGCHDCHSPKTNSPTGPVPDETRLLSGAPAHTPVPEIPKGMASMDPQNWGVLTNLDLTAWAGPWGVSFPANLTPDVETGLGSWTEEMFMKAIRTGKHMGEGRPILPPMPWQNFALLEDENLKAIFAYLRSLPAIRNAVPEPIPPQDRDLQ